MVWEESKNSRKKMGFSLGRERHKNFDPKELVIPRGFAPGKRDKNHFKELKEPSRSRAQESTKENRNSSKTRHKSYEIEMNSKPRRAQGGLGLLSHTISVQSLQESIPKFLSLERKEGGEREEQPRQEKGRAAGFKCLAQGRQERGE